MPGLMGTLYDGRTGLGIPQMQYLWRSVKKVVMRDRLSDFSVGARMGGGPA